MGDSKLYYFLLRDTQYANLHALIRSEFDSPNNICPSSLDGDLAIVKSVIPPINLKPVSLIENPIQLSGSEKRVQLTCRVAFDNRHRENIIPSKLFPLEALEKFSELSGLAAESEKCFSHFLGARKEQKFNIHNCFHLEGKFLITNFEKFKKVYDHGVGGRKSYGYGLIVIKGVNHE